MKMYRIVSHVIALNSSIRSKEDLISAITNGHHIEFHTVKEVLETDIGEWDDDHELNYKGCDHDKYFPELSWKSNDSEEVTPHFRAMRAELMNHLNTIDRLNDQNERLEEEIGKLKKVKELLKNIKDI